MYQRQTTQLLPSAPFYRTCPAEEVFLSCFRTSASAEEKYLRLSAADIYKELKKRNAAALRGFNPNHFAQVLIKWGRTEAYGIWECIFGGKTMNFTCIILSYIMCLYHQILRITHRPSLRPPSRESIPFSVRDSISRLIVRSVTFVFWDISEIVIVPSACMNSSIIC